MQDLFLWNVIRTFPPKHIFCYLLAPGVVHLELLLYKTSTAFIRAFKRLSSRHGSSDVTLSNNFKTFKSSEVDRFLLHSNVEQKFFYLPHLGGFYKYLIRKAKLPLRKIFDKALLSIEELKTMLYQTEFAINSRPLIYVNEDNLRNALIPFYLIDGKNLTSKTSRTSEMLDVTKRYHYTRKLITGLYWLRFHKTSLNKLRQHIASHSL